MLSKAEQAKRKAQSERDKKIQQSRVQSERDKKEHQRKAQVERHRIEQLRKEQSKRDKELYQQALRGQDQSQQLKQQDSISSILPQLPQILPQQLGLKVLFEPDSAESIVDVVAVHGIGANPDFTWITSGVNWLQHRSMLPQALPKARIMRFGYASRWFGEETIRQTLPSIADSFLFALREEREVKSGIM